MQIQKNQNRVFDKREVEFFLHWNHYDHDKKFHFFIGAKIEKTASKVFSYFSDRRRVNHPPKIHLENQPCKVRVPENDFFAFKKFCQELTFYFLGSADFECMDELPSNTKFSKRKQRLFINKSPLAGD